MTAARVFAVTADGRPAGTLEHDPARHPTQVWRFRSASGAVERFFQRRSHAKEMIAWLAGDGCRPEDVLLVERQEEAA